MRESPLNSIEEAVDLKEITAGYGSDVVLDRGTLLRPRGDFIGLIGPNGGGKTTLLNVLLGLVPHRSGSVSILGEPPAGGRRHIGYVPQSGGHDPKFPVTVWEVASMGCIHGGNLLRKTTTDDREAIADSLEKTGMLDQRDRPMGELSMGQRQRVLFARALAVRPSILLLDEPTASMDPGAASSVYELLQRLNDTVTIIMTSHDLTAVFSEVKTIACLNRTLHYHGREKLSAESIGRTYQCPVDIITHGEVPHRVLPIHLNAGGDA